MRKGILWVGCLLFFVCFLLVLGILSSKSVETEVLYADAKTLRCTLNIAQIGDVHFPYNGVETDEILKILKEIKPDFIFLTGDIFDGESSESDIKGVQKFLQELSLVALCFAVLGNHEIGHPCLETIRSVFRDSNICLLENKGKVVEIKGEKILIYGVSDAYPYYNKVGEYPIFLLSHRPEMFPQYLETDNPPDYVFAGHAHGGQVRFGSAGLYAPDQGFFPAYTSGLYEKNGRYLVVTRGLGGKKANIRVNNKYHIPILEIKP